MRKICKVLQAIWRKSWRRKDLYRMKECWGWFANRHPEEAFCMQRWGRWGMAPPLLVTVCLQEQLLRVAVSHSQLAESWNSSEAVKGWTSCPRRVCSKPGVGTPRPGTQSSLPMRWNAATSACLRAVCGCCLWSSSCDSDQATHQAQDIAVWPCTEKHPCWLLF